MKRINDPALTNPRSKIPDFDYASYPTVGDVERRIEHANALIGCIASCGRRFFDGDPVARIYCDKRGHPWFVDGYTQKHIYLYYPRWGDQQGFSQGGTLRELINQLKEWIIGNRAFVSRGVFQHWGYGADMQIVFDEAVRLGILEEEA